MKPLSLPPLAGLLIICLHGSAVGQQPWAGANKGPSVAQRSEQLPAHPSHARIQFGATVPRDATVEAAAIDLSQRTPDHLEILPAPLRAPDAINQQPLTLEDFESMALSANPSVARAAALVQSARGNWVQVGLGPNPIVGYEGQQLGSGGLAEQHGVFIEQEFVRGGKLRLNREAAAHEIARVERELAAQQQRVITDVRIAYYNVLIAQQQEQLGHELLQIAEQSVKLTNELLQAKEVARPDLLQAQIESENARILAFNAGNRRATAWQTLKTIVGQPNMPLQVLAGDPAENLPRLDFGQVLDRLITRSPEIAAAIANVERSRWALQRAMVERVPNLTLQGTVNVVDNGIDGRSDGNVLIGVPLPLWNKNQGGVIQAQGEAIAAERMVEQIELDLQNRVAPVFERYSNAFNQVRRYQESILPVAQESLDLTRKSYGAGEIDFVPLLTAQRTYSQTRLGYLDALRELRENATQLEGFLLSGSLQNR